MEGTSLDPSVQNPVHTSELLRGKVSLVAMLSSRMSEAHVDSFVNGTVASSSSSSTNTQQASVSVLETFKSDPLFQYVQINCQENTLKWLLVGLFVSSLRRSVPPEYRRTYLVSTENLEYLREVRM